MDSKLWLIGRPVHSEEFPAQRGGFANDLIDSLRQRSRVVIRGTDDDSRMISASGLMQSQEVQTVKSQHRPSFTLRECQDFLIRDPLICTSRFQSRQHIVPQLTQSDHDPLMEILV